MIILPGGCSAARDTRYAERHIRLIDRKIHRVFLLYNGSIKTVANVLHCCKFLKVSVGYYRIKNAFYGCDDFIPAIKTVIKYAAKGDITKATVITSGGTTKLGHIAIAAGNILEELGIDVEYYWASYNGKNGEMILTEVPKIHIAKAQTFVIEFERKTKILKYKEQHSKC